MDPRYICGIPGAVEESFDSQIGRWRSRNVVT
jgi:hypothetical protein